MDNRPYFTFCYKFFVANKLMQNVFLKPGMSLIIATPTTLNFEADKIKQFSNLAND